MVTSRMLPKCKALTCHWDQGDLEVRELGLFEKGLVTCGCHVFVSHKHATLWRFPDILPSITLARLMKIAFSRLRIGTAATLNHQPIDRILQIGNFKQFSPAFELGNTSETRDV
jgi:hypothetical protein